MNKIAAKSAPITDSCPISEESDFLQIKAIDHVQFYVGNARHAMYYWWKAYGFTPVAYSGLETGNHEFASYVLQSGQARFVVSAIPLPFGEGAGMGSQLTSASAVGTNLDINHGP